MSWHHSREDSGTEADLKHASKRPRSAQSPPAAGPDLSLVPAGNGAITRLLQSGHLPAAPSAGNAAVARMVGAATVQRAELPAQGAGPLDPEIATAIDAERAGGAPLPDGIRTEMEGHLGVDLSPVRVHTGQRADTLNRAVSAEAFTSGTDVFFSAGTYNPTSSSGRELLAHELTHVAQQATGTADAGARVSHPADASEVEARDVAQRVMRSASGATKSPGELPALQRLAGNRGVAGMLDGHGKAAMVQRENGADPKSTDGPLATLGDEGTSDVVSFMGAVRDMYASEAYFLNTGQIPEPVVGVRGPLGEVERRLVHTWNLVRQKTPDVTEQFTAHWDRLRPELDAVAGWAAGHDLKELVGPYRRAVQSIETMFLKWYSRQVIDSRADLADVGNPEAAYEQEIADQNAATAKLQLKLLEKIAATQTKDRAKVLDRAKSGVKGISEAASGGAKNKHDIRAAPAPPAGAGAASAKLSGEMLALGLNIVSKGGTLGEQWDGLKQAGVLKATATRIDVTAFVVDTLTSTLSLAARTSMAFDAKAGEVLRTLSGQLDSAGMKQLKNVTQVVGYVTAIAGVASSALKLIDAIDSGDERAIVEASGGLVSSATGAAMTIAGASAAATMAVGGVIAMWTAGIIMAGELGAMLRQMDLDAKGRAAAQMVDDAAVAAASGRRMATAWEEAQLRKLTALDRPESTEARAVEVLEASARLEITKNLLPQMSRVLADLERFRDDEDVGVKVRQALSEHLGVIGVRFGRMENPHPNEFTELCRTVFADVDAVVKAIAKRAGHLPERPSSRRTSS